MEDRFLRGLPAVARFREPGAGFPGWPFDVTDLSDRNELVILVFGDSGTGKAGQYRVGHAMYEVCRQRGCDFALMLGDNIYDNGIEVRARSDADKRQLGSDGKLPPTLEAELACSGPFRPKARLLPLISFSTPNGNWAPGRPNMRSCSDSGLAGGCLPGGGTEKALLSSCYPPRVEQPPLLVISIKTVNFDSSPTSSDWLSCSSENQLCFYKVNA